MRIHDMVDPLPPVGGEGVHDAETQIEHPRDASFPLERGMCLSYWLQGVRNNPLLDHRTTHILAESADVVIIGSGVS